MPLQSLTRDTGRMKSQSTNIVISIVIYFIVLSCQFTSMTFAQDYEKTPRLAVNNTIEPATKSFDTISVDKEFVIPPNIQMTSPIKRQLVRKKVIRDFVLYNYAHLANDIINGQGMYLETLFYLMEIAEDEKDYCQKEFLTILLKNKRIPEISEYFAEYYQES